MKKIIHWLFNTKVGQTIITEVVIKYLEKFIVYLKEQINNTHEISNMSLEARVASSNRVVRLLYILDNINLKEFVKNN